MNDIEKIQLLHDLCQTFVSGDRVVSELSEQIEDADKRENIERFFRGYSFEDNFHFLFSALPWVQMIHSLRQMQLPNFSKSVFQVPDFQVFFEDFSRSYHPLLVEVKTVGGRKKSLKLMKKQVQSCVKYANTSSHPLVFAIYWEGWNLWTLNSVDQFISQGKNLKLFLEAAIKNDLSAILGNPTYRIPILRRVTVCDSAMHDVQKPQHEIYGTVVSDCLIVSENTCIPLSYMDGSVFDSFSKLKEVSVENKEDKTLIIEESCSKQYIKLLSIIMAYTAFMSPIYGKDNSRFSLHFIMEFLEKLDFPYSFSIPNENTQTSYALFSTAFAGTSLLNEYESYHCLR